MQHTDLRDGPARPVHEQQEPPACEVACAAKQGHKAAPVSPVCARVLPSQANQQTLLQATPPAVRSCSVAYAISWRKVRLCAAPMRTAHACHANSQMMDTGKETANHANQLGELPSMDMRSIAKMFCRGGSRAKGTARRARPAKAPAARHQVTSCVLHTYSMVHAACWMLVHAGPAGGIMQARAVPVQ